MNSEWLKSLSYEEARHHAQDGTSVCLRLSGEIGLQQRTSLCVMQTATSSASARSVGHERTRSYSKMSQYEIAVVSLLVLNAFVLLSLKTAIERYIAFKDIRDAETKAEIMAHLEKMNCRD